jgi:serine protease Do
MKWKRFGTLFLAAVLGSVLTTGAFYLLEDNKSVTVEHLSSTPVLGASYVVNEDGEVVPLEFTGVAKSVTPAVVHIKSTTLNRSGRNSPWQKPEPFRSPNDDFFRYFFGPDFRFDSPNPENQLPPDGNWFRGDHQR